ncbi:vp1054 [Sucra jujuba nucleopolyhedrovirus]|uniref:Vp1054 n=1 Tax=Sucra jujuba nucleopolyhedrovirus TaxID=1563660 RepID=A0A097P8X5_9ABAC|nr:vp1054 [Sucra jujuba nucleopolyhedrovirus]AIU41280.1 vp1054 [Sucra jujuba nucleopolyhedrovirus]
MSSTKKLVRFRQCVSVKLLPFKPIKKSRQTCLLHPLRANCLLIRDYDTDNDDDHRVFDDENVYRDTDMQAIIDYTKNQLYHETELNTVYLNYNQKPYYTVLIVESDTSIRGFYNNADEMYAYLKVSPISEEIFFGIDESGERNMKIIGNVVRSIMDAFEQCTQYVILLIDELQIDLIYSMFRTFVLPQRMIAIHFSDHVPILQHSTLNSVPSTDDAVTCQMIYRTFVLYNTVLSMILKQRNPFNDPSKNISVIFRNLGRCPLDKNRIKCCDLKYGGNAPGHVMCPPREMVKRVFHYAKWSRSPNNYRRYYELITKPSPVQNKFVSDIGDDVEESIENYTSIAQRKRQNIQHILMDWYNFVYDFRKYFGV